MDGVILDNYIYRDIKLNTTAAFNAAAFAAANRAVFCPGSYSQCAHYHYALGGWANFHFSYFYYASTYLEGLV